MTKSVDSYKQVSTVGERGRRIKSKDRFVEKDNESYIFLFTFNIRF